MKEEGLFHAQLHDNEPRLGMATIDGLFSPKQGAIAKYELSPTTLQRLHRNSPFAHNNKTENSSG